MSPVWALYGSGMGPARARCGSGTAPALRTAGPSLSSARSHSHCAPGPAVGPDRAHSAAYTLPTPSRSLVRAGPRCQDAARAPPVLLRVPRRRSFRFRTPRLTGPELHRAQAECSLPADCISQRALRRRAALCRAEGPQSTLGDVVRNGEGGGRHAMAEAFRADSPVSPGPGAAFWRRCSFRLGACVRGSVSGKSSRRASGLRPPSAVSPRPAGPPPTPTWPRSARDAASG